MEWPDDNQRPGAFRLPSNRGWESLRGRLLGRMSIRGEIVWLAEFHLAGQMYKRDESTPRELVEDYDVRLPQVVLSDEGLAHLVTELGSWLEEMREFECDLGARDNRVRISVGQRDDVIYRRDRPTFSITCDTGMMNVEVKFAVDYSCVKELHDGLVAAIRELSK